MLLRDLSVGGGDLCSSNVMLTTHLHVAYKWRLAESLRLTIRSSEARLLFQVN